ncbi:hypothetical protein DET54_104138 [Paenibacillus pabuli]|uniref:Uncharacterized protein n=1 Tax=Paenibacillus pabuli TaxID=1472 RepID=A0A855XPB1_9BACL|nr:hypothetical protein DET56_111132 [Paenibacillus pabuli]PXW03178.1 hypothetical protein DEU73_110132 [Paenibacillus taichungensis]RAI98082.1 hypothetical protein DET54_104138 [Paenibacillus pabuli]
MLKHGQQQPTLILLITEVTVMGEIAQILFLKLSTKVEVWRLMVQKGTTGIPSIGIIMVLMSPHQQILELLPGRELISSESILRL